MYMGCIPYLNDRNWTETWDICLRKNSTYATTYDNILIILENWSVLVLVPSILRIGNKCWHECFFCKCYLLAMNISKSVVGIAVIISWKPSIGWCKRSLVEEAYLIDGLAQNSLYILILFPISENLAF